MHVTSLESLALVGKEGAWIHCHRVTVSVMSYSLVLHASNYMLILLAV